MKRIRGDRVNWTPEMRKKMSEDHLGTKNSMYGKEGFWRGKKRPDMTGDKHPLYKGGWVQQGYLFKTIEGKTYPYHRYIYEQYHKIKLTDNDVVHHINGNKQDNRVENLQLMTRSEHINHHRKDVYGGRKSKRPDMLYPGV